MPCLSPFIFQHGAGTISSLSRLVVNPPTGSSATKVIQPHLAGGRPEGAAAGTGVCPACRAA